MKSKLNFEALETRVVLDGEGLLFDGNLDSVAGSSVLLAVNEVDSLDWSRDFTARGSFDISEELYSRSAEGTVWNGTWEARVHVEKIAGQAENVRLTVDGETRVAMGSLAEGVESELVVSRIEINAQKINPAQRAYLDAAITVEVEMRMPIEGLSGRNHHWLSANMRNFRIIMDNPQSFSVVVSSIGLNQQIDFATIGQSSDAFFGNSEVTVNGRAQRWVYENLGGNSHYSLETILAANTGLYACRADGRGVFEFESKSQARTMGGIYGGLVSSVDLLSSAAAYKATHWHEYYADSSNSDSYELQLYRPSPYWNETWDDGYPYVDLSRLLGSLEQDREEVWALFPENADPAPWQSVKTVYNSYDSGEGTLAIHSRLHVQAADRIFAGMASIFN